MILFFVLMSLSAIAITPEELRESVIKNFPLIEEAVLKREAADADVLSGKGEFDHKLKFKSRNRIEDKFDNQIFETSIERNTGVQGISLIGGHRQGVGTFPLYDGKFKTSALGEIYAGISVPLLRDRDTDEGRTNLAVQRIERDQSREDVRVKQFMYVHKALSLYYKWIAEDRVLKINRELLELALQRESMLQIRFKRGDVEKVKLTDNERTIAKREAEVQKSEVKLRSIEAQLILFTGDVTRISSLEDKDLRTLSDPQLGSLPDPVTLPQVKILTLEQKKGKLLRDLNEQSRLPGLGVDLLGSRELSGNYPYDPNTLQVGVRFDFPLENRKARGKTVSQEYKLQALERRLAYTLGELKANYDNAVTVTGINLRRFTTTSSEADMSRTMAEAERVRFRMGGSELFTVILRELDVADAEIRKWSSWYDFHQSVLDAKLFNGTI